MARLNQCTSDITSGRLAKAEQFWQSAENIAVLARDEDEDVGDAYATLCVHAGIAAADVICCIALGKHAQGDSHRDAVALLATVDKGLSNYLQVLLGLKTRSGYSHQPTSKADQTRAGRAAGALM